MDVQCEYLKERKQSWGTKWVIRGDFNDIRDHNEKKCGKKIHEYEFDKFRHLFAKLEMGEIKLKGESLLGQMIETMKASFKKGVTDSLDLQST